MRNCAITSNACWPAESRRHRVPHRRASSPQRIRHGDERVVGHFDPRSVKRRLARLADDEDAAWSRVEAMIATRKPPEYDAAVALLTDLQALAERDDRDDTFSSRASALRRTHARKPTLIERLNRAGI